VGSPAGTPGNDGLKVCPSPLRADHIGFADYLLFVDGNHEAPVLILPHHNPAGVARQALRCFRGNVDPPFENGLAGLLWVGQHWGVDMHHHLVALAWRAGIDPVVQRRLREQGQGVRLLLRLRRTIQGRVGRLGRRLLALHPVFRTRWEPPGRPLSVRAMIFAAGARGRLSPGRCGQLALYLAQPLA
jgi:hypothetical protein